MSGKSREADEAQMRATKLDNLQKTYGRGHEATSHGLTAEVAVPTIGRIVHYRLTADDAATINEQRYRAKQYFGAGEDMNMSVGQQLHVGRHMVQGETCAMIVTAALGNARVNGQVILDGNDHLWCVSVSYGTANGCWSWPPRV